MKPKNFLGHKFPFQANSFIWYEVNILVFLPIYVTISFRNPLSETPTCNWGEFFVLYKDNISCNMRRYPQHKVKFYIWSKIVGRYKVNQKRNGRFKANFYFKISDVNRICSAFWFKFIVRFQLKNPLSEVKFVAHF